MWSVCGSEIFARGEVPPPPPRRPEELHDMGWETAMPQEFDAQALEDYRAGGVAFRKDPEPVKYDYRPYAINKVASLDKGAVVQGAYMAKDNIVITEWRKQSQEYAEEWKRMADFLERRFPGRRGMQDDPFAVVRDVVADILAGNQDAQEEVYRTKARKDNCYLGFFMIDEFPDWNCGPGGGNMVDTVITLLRHQRGIVREMERLAANLTGLYPELMARPGNTVDTVLRLLREKQHVAPFVAPTYY